MKPTKALFLLSLFVLSFAGKNKNDLRDADYIRTITPPNCVLIDENLYIDQTEISNFHWLEYLYWNKRIFGKKSLQYAAVMPDTTVWSQFDEGLTQMDKFGMRHPAYRDRAVVGLSKAQAEAFAKWRSDRVFEYLLIHAKLIEHQPDQNATNYFTTERYLKGEFMNYKPEASLTHVPVFVLPDAVTWKKALAYANQKDEAYFNDCKGKKCEELKKITVAYSRENVFEGDSVKHDIIRPVLEGRTAPENSIYNMLGNVAEMVSENGIAMGGSWAQTKEEILMQPEYNFSEPLAWIGFRCSCSWMTVADYLKKYDTAQQ